jgi:SAM-dependent methyltransferase
MTESNSGAGLEIVDAVHSRLVHSRRISVLANAISSLIPPGKKLLDVGCGDGQLDVLLKDRIANLEIEGVETHARPGCAVPCRIFDGVELPFDDNSFDGCLFVDVLHHTTEPEKILRDACRVSREFIVIKDHLAENNFDHRVLRFMDWVGNRSHGVFLPYNYLAQANWDRLFRSLGLEPAKTLLKLPLYPFPFSLLFGRKLHFVVLLKKLPRPAALPSSPSTPPANPSPHAHFRNPPP